MASIPHLDNQITQELFGGHIEGVSFRIDPDLVLSEAIEHFAQVFYMVGPPKTLQKHVVNVYLHGMPNQVLEDLVDHSLEGCSGILHSERHHVIAIDSLIDDEHLLVFIWCMHFDLIVSDVDVHKAE